MHRWTSTALIALLLALLIVSVFVQAWALPHAVDTVVSTFPEVKPLAVPSIIWGVVAIACWQAIAVIGLRIVMLVREHKFHASSYGWLRAIIGCLIVFIVLDVSAFIALNVMEYTTPGVMLGLIAGGLIALAGTVSLALFLGTRPAVHYSHS